MKDLFCFGRYDGDNKQCIRCNDHDCIHFEHVRMEEENLTLEDLKLLFAELEKKSFSVDFGQTEAMAVKLVDIEDMLINQFK